MAAGVAGHEEAGGGHGQADGSVDLAHVQGADVVVGDQVVSQVAAEEDCLPGK